MSSRGEADLEIRGAFGELLRAWRAARGHSQLALSGNSGVSTRHLSYLETGRANPSRAMVLRLAGALDLPLRDRNAFLQAAGFAALYHATPLESRVMAPVRDAIQFLLRATEPNPAFVVNRRYDVLDANVTARWMLATFTKDLARFAPSYNLARLMISAAGMRSYVENWEGVAGKVLRRVQRELGGPHARDAADDMLLREIKRVLSGLQDESSPSDPVPVLIPVRLRRPDVALRLFTSIATLGTPLDVTLQELRIEILFPADAETRDLLAERRPGGAADTSADRP